MDAKDISDEEWREYHWVIPSSGNVTTYRITSPQKLWVGKTTHRVMDWEGTVHILPSVGELGCVVLWKPRDPANPVKF